MDFCSVEYKEAVTKSENIVNEIIEFEKNNNFSERYNSPYLYTNIYKFMNNCLKICRNDKGYYNDEYEKLYDDLLFSYIFEKAMDVFELNRKQNNSD